MVEIEFSLMDRGPGTLEVLTALLKEFEAKRNVRVHPVVLNWDTSWEVLVKYALYKHGPEVSEVGSTWLSNLIGMDALRPFAAREINEIGGASVFVPSLWKSTMLPGESNSWGVPWLADVRGIYYRSDWLNDAGIDEQTAFRTHGDLVRTLERLEAHGVAMPWSVPTQLTVLTLHAIASWVWGAGGRFLNPNGRELMLTQPEAMAGLKGYFDLRRFMPPAARGLTAPQATNLFTSGQAATTIGGQWLSQGQPSDRTQQWGVSLMPGASFVGGSHLVVWQHMSTRHERAVLELIAFLTSQSFQRQYGTPTPIGMLPVRLDVLGESSITADPVFGIMATALKSGRTFTTSLRWGLVEDKLNEAFARIWEELLANPSAETVPVILKYLEPTVARLNATLSR